MSEFDDKPIESPEEDKFSVKKQAQAIGNVILKMTEPEGTIIAVNGPWGSGKSSLINLVRNHLPNDDDLKIVEFKCWWFRGEEALLIAFLGELYAAMKPNVGRKAKKVISKLGPRLLIGTSQIVGSILNFTTMPGAGSVVSKSMNFIGDYIKQAETVEKLHKELSDALRKDSMRYLIIIDDIDRLSPDEAILIFRLVKSVGGLPNVIYLLAYDRHLAEKIISEHYPSEGPHYLEKIVQVSFDLPEPSRTMLEKEFLTRLENIIEEREFEDGDHFRNLFAEMIAPEIKTPRDLIRILNPLKVTWPAVKGEVNIADFLCVETLRVKRPGLYHALRSNKDLLTKVESGEEAFKRGYRSRPPSEDSETQPYKHPQAQTYEEIFLKREHEDERERLRRGLMLLFPALARTWSPSNYRDDDPDIWERQRRICSPKHFDTYFRFALQDDALSSGEIKKLIARTGDPAFITQSLLDASRRKLPNGDTRAGLLLDALRVHADEIADNNIRSLLKAVYSIADTLIIKGERNFMLDSMVLQLDDLTRTLIMQRFVLDDRSVILLDACAEATLTYLVAIAKLACNEHFSQKNEPPNPVNHCLTTRDHACKLKDIAVTRIREAAADGSLTDAPYLRDMLLWWIDNEDDEERVGSWASNVLENNLAVVPLVKAFISIDPSRNPAKQLDADLSGKLGRIVDLDKLKSLADRAVNKENLEAEDRNDLQTFLDARQSQETGNNDNLSSS